VGEAILLIGLAIEMINKKEDGGKKTRRVNGDYTVSLGVCCL
jgi:hypothetical protein